MTLRSTSTTLNGVRTQKTKTQTFNTLQSTRSYTVNYQSRYIKFEGRILDAGSRPTQYAPFSVSLNATERAKMYK
jgi:hypothetical protein